MPMASTGYWVLINNPRTWAIDRFIRERLPDRPDDTWGVRPSDAPGFAPGQLALIRVGRDNRTIAERHGRPKLQAGIYAVCEVLSKSFTGRGSRDEFWAPGEAPGDGCPTVRIRYLRSYLDNPLTIAMLRSLRPRFNNHVLNSLQTSSFPIPEDDFRFILTHMDGGEEAIQATAHVGASDWAGLADLESRLLDAAPALQEVVSTRYERGPVGDQVKRANGYCCQICEALGQDPYSFKKPNGELYAEAHHVVPVSSKQVGAGAHRNVISVCANHHRQLHYGGVTVKFISGAFRFSFPGGAVAQVPRFRLST
jgi:hypothetical protein